MELRALNVDDTLANAKLIADALQQKYPDGDPAAVFDRALIAIEAASATTRLALALPEPHRSRILSSLKTALSLLIDPATLERREHSFPKGKRHRKVAVSKPQPKGKPATAKAGPSNR
jgi:hypothetical protein